MDRPICRRHHLFEINDEPWFPQFLRERVQACLAVLWTVPIPVVQRVCPAQLVASVIARILDVKTSAYTFVDFCSGAGGPTPFIEKYLNHELVQRTDHESRSRVQFLLTDLHPHLEAWEAAVKKSDNLGFVKTPVDATNAPKDLLKHFDPQVRQKRQFRLFSLAFHHFDDDLAIKVLENCLETADGFGIFELQHRDIATLILVTLLGPLLFLMSPFLFYHDPTHLLFQYVCPIIPAVIMFDGMVSALRTRTPQEVMALLQIAARNVAAKSSPNNVPEHEAWGSIRGKNGNEEEEGGGRKGDLLLKDWNFMSGSEMHTVPFGTLHWIICVKKHNQGVA